MDDSESSIQAEGTGNDTETTPAPESATDTNVESHAPIQGIILH